MCPFFVVFLWTTLLAITYIVYRILLVMFKILIVNIISGYIIENRDIILTSVYIIHYKTYWISHIVCAVLYWKIYEGWTQYIEHPVQVVNILIDKRILHQTYR